MLNQVILVGRLTKDLEVKELEDGRARGILTLAIPRSYKNAEGEYETDFVECIVWDSIAKNTNEYCKQGDIIGVKGRLETVNNDDKYITNIIAEKVTFLSSRKANENEDK